MKLNLGVVDVAYSDASGNGAKTTGEVAEILEDKYHPMELFYEGRGDDITEWLAEAISDQIKDLAAGAPVSNNPYARAEERIGQAFRDFLDADEISSILPLNQQITAAQIGINSRRKSGYNKGNKARPALIDTGLYQRSFRAWIDDADES